MDLKDLIRQEEDKYCHCGSNSVTMQDDGTGFGYWYVCTKCGKRVDDELHYYNHYDGEDHDDIDDF